MPPPATKPLFKLDPERSRVILIGSGEFERDEKTYAPLKAVTRNLRSLEKIFSGPLFGIEDIVRLDNRPYPDLMDRFRKACADETGCLIVYYVGHGTAGADRTLLLADFNTTHDGRDDNAVPFRSLLRHINAHKSSQKIVILDCCFSGRAIREFPVPQTMALQPVAPPPEDTVTREHIEEFFRGPGKLQGSFVVAACAATLQAYSPPNYKHTGFTQHLIDVLEGGIDSVDEVLTIRQVFDAVSQRCENDKPPLPKPVKSFAEDGDYIPFCYNAQLQKSNRKKKQFSASYDAVLEGLFEKLSKADAGLRKILLQKRKAQAQDEELENAMREADKAIAADFVKRNSLALKSPLAEVMFSYEPFVKFFRGNPFGIQAIREHMVIEISKEGDTRFAWHRHIKAGREEIHALYCFATGDSPNKNLNLSIKLDTNAPGVPRVKGMVPLSETDNAKEFVIYLAPPVK